MEVGGIFVSTFQKKCRESCCHIWLSLSRRTLISFWRVFTNIWSLPFTGCNLALAKSFLFSSSNFLVLPKEFLLHYVSFSPHVWIFLATCSIAAPIRGKPQALVTASLHLPSLSHICSNLKVRFGLGVIPSGFTIMAWWSEELEWRCWIFVPGFWESHWLFATAWSSLSSTKPP